MMTDMNMNEFLNVLSSKEPVPGGGGACGYVAAVGMSLGTDESRKSVAMACSPVAGTAAARAHHNAAKYRHGRGMDWNANRRADFLFYHPHHPPTAEQIEKGNRNNGLFCRSWSR